MNQSEMSTLRHQVESIEIPPVVRDSVLQLINEHGTQQRAESFWSTRAPAMNDELLILREVELSARAVCGAIAALVEPARSMGNALLELDKLRANRTGT